MDALQIFRLVAPEFSDIPDNDVLNPSGGVDTYGVNTYLDLYKDQISQKRFGSFYNKALAYLTAHKLKMNGFGNTENGTIAESLRFSSYSEGETSVSFASSQQTNLGVDGEFALTVYGLEYLNLRRNSIISIVSAGEAQ